MKDDEFDRKIKQVLPWLPKALAKVGKKMEKFDGREPVTMMAEVEKDLHSIAERVKAQEIEALEGVWSLLVRTASVSEMDETMQSCISLVEQQAAADPRSFHLLRLIDEAEARVPFVSYVALGAHIDFQSQLRPLCLPGTLLEEAGKKKGEAKATLLIDALGKMAELLYDPYLRALWKLTCFARGKWPKGPERFGSLVNELSPRLAGYPGLIDADAGWMRNSARHERWFPVPGEEAVIMWDNKVPKRKVTLKDLEVKVTDMYFMAGQTFGSVARLYFFRNMLAGSGMWETYREVMPAVFAMDWHNESEAVALEKELEAKMEKVRNRFAPLIAFMEANGQSGANPRA